MQSPHVRIYRLKTILIGAGSLVAGIALLLLARLAEGEEVLNWLRFWPLGELGAILFGAGAFGVAWEYLDARDKETRDDERIRRLLRESAPDFRDAVIAGFVDSPANMRGVATDETLDRLATNALALRLGDEQFAREIYTDVRDQAIRTPERWYDVDVKVRVTSAAEPNTAGVSPLEVLVSWEYTVTPSHIIQRFACTSDLDEFHELVSDVPATSTWFMTPRPGFDASSAEAFELLSFSVDGGERTIRRRARRSGQTYSVAIGDDVVSAQQPVRIRHTYRTITDPANHRLFLAISQPARDVSMEVDYSASTISRMSVTDLVPSSRRPYVRQLPVQASGRELTIDVPGWVQAGTGFTFVWTLASEESSGLRSDSSSATARAE